MGDNEHGQNKSYSKSPWKSILIYTTLGFAWIYFSDHLLAWFIKDELLYREIQTYKGTFYVLVTGILLYFVIKADYAYILRLLNTVNQKNSELSEAVENIQSQKDFIQEIYKNCNTSILLWKSDGSIIEVNDCFCDTFGYTSEEALSMNVLDLLVSDLSKDSLSTLLMKLESGENLNYYESEARSKSGAILNIIWTSSLVRDRNATAGSQNPSEGILVSFGIDVTAEKLNEKKLHDFAYTDRISRLHNRASFEIHLNILTSHKNPFTLYYMDLDDFKHLNDIYGHHYGDHFIMDFADRLRSRFDEHSLFHWGGDEFILVDNNVDEEGIARTLDAISAATRQKWTFEHVEYEPSASIGYSTYPSDGMTSESLMKNIDMALHEAKITGKSKAVRFTSDLQSQIERGLNVEKAIKQALEQNGFKLHFQPLYDFKTSGMASIEALIRWNMPDFPLSTWELIEVAEERGLILLIDRWVINQAFNYAKKLPEGSVLNISINLSARSVSSRSVIDYMKERLEYHGISPECIQFELTEHSLVDDMAFAKSILDDIHGIGFKVALDDFGTRYSSLNYLSTIPFDTLKIDKSYIDDIASNQKKRVVVEEIIRLSRKMGLQTVAEGIETKEQHDILLELGCDFGQGYLYARPGPFEQFI